MQVVRAAMQVEDGARSSDRADPQIPNQIVEIIAIFGAGEGIRTLDPNLGKVVLYP